MRNKLSDLNNYLFEQMERLNEDDISKEGLEKEVIRTRAITSIAGEIINTGELALKAQKHRDEMGYGDDSSQHRLVGMLE